MNRFSQIQFGDAGNPVNQEFLHDTLSTLQQKYDAGYLTVAKTIDAYNNLPIVSLKDKEKVNQKINSLTQQLNGYGNLDLADSKVVADLSLKAQGLQKDPEFMNILSSNKNITLLQERWEKIKSNPKLAEKYWNPINEAKDLKKIQDYMDGKISKFDSAIPTLYVDTNKIATDLVKGMAPQMGFKIDNGYIIEGKYRHASDMVALQKNTLSSNAAFMGQINMEADSIFDSNGYNTIGSSLKSSINASKAEIESAIRQYEIEKGKTGDASLKSQYEDQIKIHSEALGKINSRIENIDNLLVRGDKEGLKSLYRENYLNNFITGIAAGNVIKEERIKPDQYGVLAKNQAFQVEKLKVQQSFQERLHADKMQLEREKIEASYQNTAMRVMGKGLTKSEMGKFLSGEGVDLSSIVTEPSTVNNDENPLGTIGNEIQSINNNIVEGLKDLTLAYLKDTLGSTDLEAYRRVQQQWEKAGGLKPTGMGAKITTEQLKIVDSAAKFMDIASDPSRLQELSDNPNLSQYAGAINELQKEAFRKSLLESSIEDAQKQAWMSYKSKNPNVSFEDFKAGVKSSGSSIFETTRKNPITTGAMGLYIPSTQEAVGTNFISGSREEVNKILRNKGVTTFYKTQMIADTDKTWNKGSDRNNAVRRLASYYGVIPEGGKQVSAVNGMLRGMEAKRGEKIDSPDDIVVRGYTPGSNKIIAEFQYKGKDKGSISVEIPLPKKEFGELTGYNPPKDEKDLHSAMMMSGKTSNPVFYSIMDKMPTFKGNVQYSFDPVSNEMWELKVKVPGDYFPNKKPTDVLLKVDGRYTSVNNWAEGEAMLTQYITLLQKSLKAQQPDLSDLEIDKLALDTFYKTITGTK